MLAAADQTQRFAAIDRRRRQHDIPLPALLLESRVHVETWYLGKRGLAATKPATFKKLEAALSRLAKGERGGKRPNLVRASLAACRALVAVQVGRDPLLIGALAPKRKGRPNTEKLNAKRLSSLGIYLAAVELEIENADIARAINRDRQLIGQTRTDIEDLRDNPLVDALLDQCGRILRGEQ